MRSILATLVWLSLIPRVISEDQIPLGKKPAHKYNVTLDFDDLPTNGSGIGFHPSSPRSASTPYNNMFLDSFTVKNVAKALPDLESPIDIMCASSAPNAIFGIRKPGYPWPHISLHDLTLPIGHPRDNVTFNMQSITISPTGNITGDPSKTLVQIGLTLLKLPPNPPNEQFPIDATWPGLVRGEPNYPFGRRVFNLGYVWGVGAHQSVPIDFERIRQYIQGFGEGVDVMEVYAELYRLNEKKARWEVQSDWEFCMDDVSVEVVEGEGQRKQYDEKAAGACSFGNTNMVWLQTEGDDVMVDAEDLGVRLAKDTGKLPEHFQCRA